MDSVTGKERLPRLVEPEGRPCGFAVTGATRISATARARLGAEDVDGRAQYGQSDARWAPCTSASSCPAQPDKGLTQKRASDAAVDCDEHRRKDVLTVGAGHGGEENSGSKAVS